MIYQFGTFDLDTRRRELRRDGSLVAIEPQVFDLLTVLIESRDRVVSRDALLDAVWRGRIVSEATLASRLNAARTAVGDTGAEQRMIRTLPRRGVRFVGDVRTVGDRPPGLSAASVQTSASQREVRLPAVAVLPFADLGGAPGQDYFASGIAEEIITALSRSRGLLVIARNSSFAYAGGAVDVRQVGQELGVGYVLAGSVQRGAGRLRIMGQLVEASSGACLWADRFEGDAHDVFALQDQVAQGVAAAIEPTLQSAEIGRLRRAPPAELDAYDHLLRANASLGAFTPASLAAALGHLDAALAISPDDAPALATAAYVRAQCHFQGWAQQEEADGRTAASRAWRAVEIAPEDAQVLWMAAFAIWSFDAEERERARDLFRRSLVVNPNSAMALTLSGWIETMCGNGGEGRAMVERARRLNPRDPRGWLMSGVMALDAVIEEDFTGAVRWAEEALAQNRRFAVALRVLAVALVRLDRLDRARHVVRELLAIEPQLTVSGFLRRIPIPLERMARAYSDALSAAGLPLG